MGSKLIEVLADLVLLHAVEQTEAMMGGAEAIKLTRPPKTQLYNGKTEGKTTLHTREVEYGCDR